jgi:MYXO-CTERM domain-containing protein
MHPIVRTLTASAMWATAALPVQAALVTWDGASGTMPDAAVPQWDLVDSASPEDPALSAGVLTIGGTAIAEQMYYTMDGANADFSGQTSYWLEARLLVNTQSLTAGWWRAPVTMGIGFAGGGLAIFELRRDYVYLRDGDNSRADFRSDLDTDDLFHTWRMEVLGSTVGSTVKVYQDGNLVLSDSSVYNFGSGDRVFWGDASIIAGGRSEWTYVSTNLAAVGATGTTPVSAPGSLALAATGLLALGALRRRRALG